MNDVETIITQRINTLLSIGGHINVKEHHASAEEARKVYTGVLNIINTLYGPSSPQIEALREINTRIMSKPWAESYKNGLFILELRGTLASIKSDIEGGLIKSIQTQAKGEILADFIVLAKSSLDSDVKEVAAVLACAALEDALKRYAESLGHEVENKDLSEIINTLKAASALGGAQTKVVQSFVGVRNKAMHAEWGKIDTAEIHSIVSFVQDFIAKRF